MAKKAVTPKAPKKPALVKPTMPTPAVVPSPVTTSHPEPITIEAVDEAPAEAVIAESVTVPDETLLPTDTPSDTVETPEPVAPPAEPERILSRAESDRRKHGRYA